MKKILILLCTLYVSGVFAAPPLSRGVSELLTPGQFSDTDFVSGLNIATGKVSMTGGETYKLSPALINSISSGQVALYSGMPARFSGHSAKGGKNRVRVITRIQKVRHADVYKVKGSKYQFKLPPSELFGQEESGLLDNPGGS